MISIEDFSKTEITIGEILSPERVEGSSKLLKLMVDFSEETPRQVISGIAAFFPEANTLVGKRVAFVTNLEPRSIMGFESQAMILTAKGSDGSFALLEVPTPKGSRVG